jgi:ribosome biogenesis GTPase A
MIVLPSDDKYQHKTHSIQQATLPIDVPHSSFQPPSPPLTDEITNILLLGETGVGKSTFINAFANYLTFNSLEQAQSNEPIVIIPVSFTMTSGDNFEEHTIKFGEFDSSDNENFNNVGQSVTQHCKSYVFDLHQFDGKKIRIIDTPGFGDTRGLDQDDRNMEHILQYINNLTHLNAICFLLKPNLSRLNIFFRTCLTQLFSFLNPDARKNVIFCFTNGRSTFYTPGDTAPLLKTMLSSDSINDIPFKKENTFCFDSESFRYLVALRNKIVFTEEDKHEYQTSWSISVKESNRLTDHIRRNLHPYFIRSEWQSIKHAQFEVSHMIRPMLETIRNILRNLILCKMNPPKVLIELRPKAALLPSAVCFTCKRQPIQVGSFWITPDCPHELANKCWTCSCSTTRHKLIDYVLEYRTMNNPSSFQPNEMNNMLNRLYFTSAEFSHFLIHGACSTNDDLFMLGLLQMIREEKDICDKKEAHHMNLQLVNDLEKTRYEYEQRMHEIASNQNRKTLTIIYDEIKTVGSYPEIREQMNAVKESQQAAMKQYEVVL